MTSQRFLISGLLLGAIFHLAAGAAAAQSPRDRSHGFTKGSPEYDRDHVQIVNGPRPEVSAAEAQLIAEGFIGHHVRSDIRPEWKFAVTKKITPFWSNDGLVQAYEVEIVGRRGQPSGWVMVEAWRDFDPVSAYTSEGLTNTEVLQAIYEVVHGEKLLESDMLFRFMWSGPGSAALQLMAPDGEISLLADAPEVEDNIYDSRSRRLQNRLSEDLERRPKRGESQGFSGSFRQERDELRSAYIHKEFNSQLFSGKNVSLDLGAPGLTRDVFEKVDIGGGASDFSSFYQERRTWNNSSNGIYYCYAGCTPVAFAIVLEYWDRNGYPAMVSSTSDNSNQSTSDSDVRWMIDELRWNLNTSCTASGGSGSTSSAYYTKAIDHVNSRGVGTWTSDNTSSSTKWSRFMGQINAGNPAVVHYDSSHSGGSIDHSGAGYEYTNNWGATNDWICVKKGWSSQTWECFTRTSVGNYHVTRLMP